MDLRLSKSTLFFGGQRHLHLYNDLNGAVIRITEPVRRALVRYVPELEAWSSAVEAREETIERARERLFRWRVLVPDDLDEVQDLASWYPARSVWSVFYVREDNAVLRARHDRATGEPVLEALEGLEAALWLACDGTRSFAEIEQAAGVDAARVRELARAWTGWERQLLKWLPRPLPEVAENGGFTSEFLSHVKNLAAFGRHPPEPPSPADRVDRRGAGLQLERHEATLSNLFRVPHPALGGRSYGGAVGAALVARGLIGRPAPRIVEVAAGTGAMANGLLGMLGRESPAVAAGLAYTIVEVAPALAATQRETIARTPGHLKDRIRWMNGSADRLPFRDATVDLLLSNEALADLEVATNPVTREVENAGALRFVDEIARVLAPGGAALLTEYGDVDAPVEPAGALDSNEHTVRFGRLVARARKHGLEASVEPVGDFLGFDRSTPLLFADEIHMAELGAVARAAGRELPILAYTREMLDEALRGALDLDRLANLSFAALGSFPPLGLSPDIFKALVMRRAAA
jgi:SAM-dependent methyltransferase